MNERPRLPELAGSEIVDVDVALPDDTPFMVSVTAVIRLKSGKVWRPTKYELTATWHAVGRAVGRGKPWAPPIRDLVVSHMLAMDEMLERDPVKMRREELCARAELRRLARELRNHFQRQKILPLREVLRIVDVRRIYHEAVVDDVHDT